MKYFLGAEYFLDNETVESLVEVLLSFEEKLIEKSKVIVQFHNNLVQFINSIEKHVGI